MSKRTDNKKPTSTTKRRNVGKKSARLKKGIIISAAGLVAAAVVVAAVLGTKAKFIDKKDVKAKTPNAVEQVVKTSNSSNASQQNVITVDNSKENSTVVSEATKEEVINAIISSNEEDNATLNEENTNTSIEEVKTVDAEVAKEATNAKPKTKITSAETPWTVKVGGTVSTQLKENPQVYVEGGANATIGINKNNVESVNFGVAVGGGTKEAASLTVGAGVVFGNTSNNAQSYSVGAHRFVNDNEISTGNAPSQPGNPSKPDEKEDLKPNTPPTASQNNASSQKPSQQEPTNYDTRNMGR